MLHMVVMTHNAESCAFRSPENDRAMNGAFARLLALAKEYQADLKGSWGNTAAHRMFALAEAPNAHAVNELIQASGLLALGVIDVYAVTPMAAVEPRPEEMATAAKA